ncbi:MAG: fasciclin domain-containing protein [Bacteroidota bacterium]
MSGKRLLGFLLIIILASACKKDLEERIYGRPDWLAGKVYDQILEQPELSTFARCIKRVGFDEIINVSGSYTIFGPSNEAWDAFFQAHSAYNTIEEIPLEELEAIVKYHIVQDPWSKRQLRSLDVFGWIDTLDITNNKPRGFKRETLLLEENQKYGIQYTGTGSTRRMIIVDTLDSDFHRIVATDSRKFAPIFFNEYLDVYNLDKADYEFYFDRTFDGPEDLYFAGSKITSDEIFAENGFIYVIDRVVEPLKTAYQLLSDREGADQYTDFLDLLNLFAQFQYDEVKTYEQPGAQEGLEVDSLFDLSYPQLVFDFNNEKTSARKGEVGLPSNVTIRYHHGMMAPTNAAFEAFINQYLRISQGWQNIMNAPDHIRRIIAKSHMSFTPVYPSDFLGGFYNGEEDIVNLDGGSIIEKQFGSNATFLGLSEAIVPRAFKSVTGPIYLRQGYSKVMYAIEAAGLLPALKRENKDYSLFVESDLNTDLDSSFYYNNGTFTAVKIVGGGFYETTRLNTDDLRTMILNHVAVRTPRGMARKEFIPNMAGNLLIFNNETGEVSGTAPTTFGFQGTIPETNYPVEIDFDADNGKVYEINNWFSFGTSDIYDQISRNYPAFHELLVEAGLAREKEFRYTFISNNEFYTIFVPNEEALASQDFSGLSTDELRNLLLLHFVRGDLIFTDGSAASGYYTTERIDEKSTPFSTFNTRIHILTGYDIITLGGTGGINNIEILESGTSNRLAGVRIQTGTEQVFPSMYNNAVIHEIGQVLNVEKLETQ